MPTAAVSRARAEKRRQKRLWARLERLREAGRKGGRVGGPSCLKMVRAIEWSMGERIGNAKGWKVRETYDQLVAAGLVDPERLYRKLPVVKSKRTWCRRCGHRWRQRPGKRTTPGPPKRCPKCKSCYWREPVQRPEYRTVGRKVPMTP